MQHIKSLLNLLFIVIFSMSFGMGTVFAEEEIKYEVGADGSMKDALYDETQKEAKDNLLPDFYEDIYSGIYAVSQIVGDAMVAHVKNEIMGAAIPIYAQKNLHIPEEFLKDEKVLKCLKEAAGSGGKIECPSDLSIAKKNIQLEFDDELIREIKPIIGSLPIDKVQERIVKDQLSTNGYEDAAFIIYIFLRANIDVNTKTLHHLAKKDNLPKETYEYLSLALTKQIINNITVVKNAETLRHLAYKEGLTIITYEQIVGGIVNALNKDPNINKNIKALKHIDSNYNLSDGKALFDIVKELHDIFDQYDSAMAQKLTQDKPWYCFGFFC